MDSFAQGIRFVFGVGMVAAGSALAVPTCLHLVELSGHGPGQPAAPAGAETAWQAPSETWPSPSSMPFDHAPSVPTHKLEYVPPPPPLEPLPPRPAAFPWAGPELAAGYRPTLQSPPPPLLDAHAAPPLAVGWTPRHSDSGMPPPHSVEQPRIYVVRDGDDLTGIASRFYGHPAAAAAIWEANRGLLPDPGILPIGAALVLPPQSAVAAFGRPADQAMIEPMAQGRPELPMARSGISRPASWLSGGGGPSGPVQPSP